MEDINEKEEIFNETDSSLNEEKEVKTNEQVLEEKISNLEKEVLEWKKEYSIKLTDFENYKKRKDKEFMEYRKYACESLIVKQLQNMDVLKMAIESANQNHDMKNLLDGINMIYTTMENTLKDEGLEKIEAESKTYDPYIHHAVSTESNEDIENDVVLKVLQEGYTLKGKVIRPAMVVINKK